MNREIIEITSPEVWHELRGKDWTVSNLDVLFDVNTYAVLADRVAVWSGRVPRSPQTRSQRRGTILQMCFPEALRDLRPEWRVVPATTYHRIPELRFGCTPDFWIWENLPLPSAVLEAKSVNERTWEEWRGRPPLGYTLQTLGQMMICEKDRGVLAIMVVSSDLPVYLFEVARHPAAEEKILAAVADFWAKWDAGEFPTLTPAGDLAAMLDDGSHKDLSADNRLPEWLERRELLVADRGTAETEIKQIDYEIKQRLGTASTAWLPGWEISWKSHHRKEYTVPEADIRVLRVKRTKETDDERRG